MLYASFQMQIKFCRCFVKEYLANDSTPNVIFLALSVQICIRTRSKVHIRAKSGTKQDHRLNRTIEALNVCSYFSRRIAG